MNAIRSLIGCFDPMLGPIVLAMQRRRNAGIVLLYHRIAPYDDSVYQPLPLPVFKEHCEFIKRNFDVLPLAEFVERHLQGRSLRGCCAITFDDGYRDFLEYAYPVLKHYSLPATQFLISDCVFSGRPDWTYRLSRLLMRIEQLGQNKELLKLSAMKEHLGSMNAVERNVWLSEQEDKTGHLPSEPPMLRIQDLKKCDPSLIEWGSHTLSHPMLGRCNINTILTELRKSRRLLEEVTGAAVRYLAYPSSSYSPEVMRVAEECGYASAFAAGHVEVTTRSPRYALARFDVGAMPKAMLRLELGGAIQPLRQLRSRLPQGVS